MRPCDHTGRLLTLHEYQPQLKKSKPSPDSAWPSKSRTNIHDLPDFVLVEILCRLPHSRFVFQCKRVCKRWSSLISDEKFRCRFLWLQSHNNQSRASMESTLIFRDPKNKSALFMLSELKLPMFKSRYISLPRLGATEYIATSDDGPNVVGMCNDLVLLCEEIYYQRDYYIWNPCTKQYVGLPPTPGCYREVRVGFICDPYYKQEDIDDLKEESITGNGMIQVDADYRYAIVRICPDELAAYKSTDVFKVEIFSSGTRKWTEWLIRSPRKFCLNHLTSRGGIAHNGLLYWLNRSDGFIVSLDPFCYSNSNSKQKECPYFHIIGVPCLVSDYDAILSVCRGGQLRMCLFSSEMEYDFDDIPSMRVFELKNDDDGDQGGGKRWNLAMDLDLDTMVCQKPVINQWRYSPTYPTMLAFDPSNEDILYLELFDHIVACNIRERKLTETALTIMFSSKIHIGASIFPFVLPRWPTPLPSLRCEV